MPIMLRSKRCMLYGKSDAELVRMRVQTVFPSSAQGASRHGPRARHASRAGAPIPCAPGPLLARGRAASERMGLQQLPYAASTHMSPHMWPARCCRPSPRSGQDGRVPDRPGRLLHRQGAGEGHPDPGAALQEPCAAPPPPRRRRTTAIFLRPSVQQRLPRLQGPTASLQQTAHHAADATEPQATAAHTFAVRTSSRHARRDAGIIVDTDAKGNIHSAVTSSTHERKSKTHIVSKHGKFALRHNTIADDVPIVIVLKAMGVASDQEVRAATRHATRRHACRSFGGSLHEDPTTSASSQHHLASRRLSAQCAF